jgi:hypothetical protein
MAERAKKVLMLGVQMEHHDGNHHVVHALHSELDWYGCGWTQSDCSIDDWRVAGRSRQSPVEGQYVRQWES